MPIAVPVFYIQNRIINTIKLQFHTAEKKLMSIFKWQSSATIFTVMKPEKNITIQQT